MRRMFKAAALALMVVVAINGPCHAQSDPSAFPPMGRMISVDGHQVHIYCTGTGAPTVILEGGRTGRFAGLGVGSEGCQQGFTRLLL